MAKKLPHFGVFNAMPVLVSVLRNVLAQSLRTVNNHWLIIFIGGILLYFPSQSLCRDSLSVIVKVELKKADEAKSENVLEAANITVKLLKKLVKHDNDSLLNLVKFNHSFYLLLLDRNQECKKTMLELLSYYKERDLKKLTTLFIRLASVEIRLGNYQKAQKYLEVALPLAKKLKMTIGQGLIYLHLSDIYRLEDDFANAYKHAEMALKLFKIEKDFNWTSLALTNLGYICVTAQDYDGARTYFYQVFENKNRISNKNFLVKPTLYLGIMNVELGKIKQAQKQLEDGLGQMNALGGFTNLAVIYQYMSRIYMLRGQYGKSKEFIDKAIKFSQKSNDKRYYYDSILSLVRLERLSNPRKDNSQKMADIYFWALKNGDNILLKEVSAFLSDFYLNVGNMQEALRFKDAYIDATEKKIAEDKLNEIALLKEKNKFEQQVIERELKQQKLELEVKNNKQLSTLVLTGFSMLLFMFGLLVYYSYLKRKAYISLSTSNFELRRTERDLEYKNEELERYIASNIQLEQFAHVASHDLRAPLITINSFAKLLEQKISDKLSDSERIYLQYIRTNGQQLQALTNDLLEYSKVNSQELSLSRIDSYALLNNVVGMLQYQADAKDVKINLLPKFPEIIADQIKIKRVLQNLISNAIKFSDPEKSSVIDIYIDERVQKWYLYVKDNGIGIKENEVDIFKPYVQLNRKEEYKGTGLGLSFCKKIVEQHGGKIAYDSEYGKGSTFYFSILKNIKSIKKY